MFKYLIPIFLITLTLNVYAQGKGSNQGDQTQQRIQDPSTHIDSTSPNVPNETKQNKNEIQTKNKGKDTQLNVSNEEQESTNSKNEKIKNNMGEVAKKVQELLSSLDDNEGIGIQVREIAQAQNKTQEQIQEQLKNLGQRRGLVKALLGTDYKTVKELNQQIYQGTQRIEQLEKIKEKLTDETQIQTVDRLIELLTEQNNLLEEEVTNSDTFSLFGWVIKLLNK